MSNLLNITTSQFVVEVASSGKKYEFEGLNNFAIENPQIKHLTRGADSLDSSGIEYSEGASQPITVTATIRTTQNFYLLFKSFFQTSTRLNVYLVDRVDGRVVFVKNAIIQTLPIQKTVGEGEDNTNVDFVLESFILDADYKGGEF
jgi:hypothetical protein